jgi:hypothetical protein
VADVSPATGAYTGDPFEVTSVSKSRKLEVVYLGDGSLMRGTIRGPLGGSGASRRFEWRLTIAEGPPERWRAWQGFTYSMKHRDAEARERCVLSMVDCARADQDAIAVARRALKEAAK